MNVWRVSLGPYFRKLLTSFKSMVEHNNKLTNQHKYSEFEYLGNKLTVTQNLKSADLYVNMKCKLKVAEKLE